MTYDQYMAAYPAKKLSRCDSTETVVDVEACDPVKEPDTQIEKSGGLTTDKRSTQAGLAATTPNVRGTDAGALKVPPTAALKSGKNTWWLR